MWQVSKETLITFGLYLLAMIGVGALFCRKNESIGEYLLGGRKIGSWVTALSAQASDMSGWLLMGLPGAIFFAGMGEVWVAIGLALGTFANWLVVAPRLRVYTEKVNALTLSTFFANRFKDPTGMLRILSAVIILLFFAIYAGSGLVAAGKLFNSIFQVDYKTAVLIGSGVILVYTLLGGYLAVCWTDFFQGLLMFVALIAVPTLAWFGIGGWDQIQSCCDAREMSLNIIPQGESAAVAVMMILSSAVWGLGYFGQPHILSRFMSISSVKALPRATTIAMIWVVISLFAAVMIGLVAIPYYAGLDKSASETVFIKLIQDLFNPYVGGVLLSALLAAIMSTIDSQLLVSSSALTEDFYRRVLRKNASEKELVWISRGFVLLITVIAMVLALNPSDTIFGIVKFAWGGFGAAFGPVVIMALYSRKTTWQSALLGMFVGTVVMLVWYFLGLNKYMYEILPGFIAGLVAMMIYNSIKPQKNDEILQDYDAMLAEVKCKK